MKVLLQWVVARGYRMALIAAVLSLLPLFSLLAQSLVVLAVLVHGFREGLLVAMVVTGVTVLPAVSTGVVSAGLVGIPVLVIGLVLGLAVVLQRSRSLSLTVQVATVAAAAAVGLSYLLGDPPAYWGSIIAESARLMPEQFGQLQPRVSEIATGAAGMVALLGTAVAVFIGRWWQSVLERPGAFGAEFRTLRLGIVMAALTSIVFVVAGITGMAPMTNITLVLVAAYLLQGLAVLHTVVASSATGSFWLVSVYALLILALPFAELAVAGIGFVDSWFNFRSRLRSR